MKTLRSTIAAFAALACTAAIAGRPCDAPATLSEESVRKGLDMALLTSQALDASGHDVVLLARAGQDLSKYQLQYSHLGFAYRETQADGSKVWRVLHKLNHCGEATADIFKQGLGEFFMDNPWKYEAAFLAVEPSTQGTLVKQFSTDLKFATRLHHRPYNMVAYPWSTKYQQSNQWVLETLTASTKMMSFIDTRNKPPFLEGQAARQKAQSILQELKFQPTVLTIDPLTRLGARITAANIAFDDHPDDKRYANKIETTTVDAVFDFLLRIRGWTDGAVQKVTWAPGALVQSAPKAAEKLQPAQNFTTTDLVRLAVRGIGDDIALGTDWTAAARQTQDTGGMSPDERLMRAWRKTSYKGWLDLFTEIVSTEMTVADLEAIRTYFASPIGQRHAKVIMQTWPLESMKRSEFVQLTDFFDKQQDASPADRAAWKAVYTAVYRYRNQGMDKLQSDPRRLLALMEKYAY